jgi:hypothetical protein
MAKKAAAKSAKEPTLQNQLEEMINTALDVAKTARKHRQSLNGVNHYANKMASLRASATVAFGRLSGKSTGDTTAMAELMDKVFSVDAKAEDRTRAARDLLFTLKTTWADATTDQAYLEEAGVFPLVTLNRTRRGYLISVGRQANGCYTSGWYDGCAVMMRRLLEAVIIEAFEAKKIDAKIKNADNTFFQLTPLISAALAEKTWNLPRKVRNELPNLRDLGHRSAHNRYYLATKPDIDKLTDAFRETVEAFLHLAGLL